MSEARDSAFPSFSGFTWPFWGGGFSSLNSHDSILSRHIPSEVKSVFFGIFFEGEKTRSSSKVFGYL